MSRPPLTEDLAPGAPGGVLRRGYTTGACAQAASAAAAQYVADHPADQPGHGELDGGSAVSGGHQAAGRIEVMLPGGEQAFFSYERDPDGTVWVTKDAGDDPDVTHGLRVGARVERTDGTFAVVGGRGVGTVTLPGLAIGVGHPAINPGPRAAILSELRSRLPGGATATISAPGGEGLAGKTLNPRLGIVGGISILGTTGRVEPWSVRAMRESLVPQLDVAAARGRSDLVFVVGSKGRRLAAAAGVDERDIVETANEVGWMLEQAAERGVCRVTVRGHVGKLVKLAARIFDTHSRVADARLVTLAAYAGARGVAPDAVRRILEATTADLAAADLIVLGRRDVLAEVAWAGAEACRERYGLEVEVVLLDRDGGLLAGSSEHVAPRTGRASAPVDQETRS